MTKAKLKKAKRNKSIVKYYTTSLLVFITLHLNQHALATPSGGWPVWDAANTAFEEAITVYLNNLQIIEIAKKIEQYTTMYERLGSMTNDVFSAMDSILDKDLKSFYEIFNPADQFTRTIGYMPEGSTSSFGDSFDNVEKAKEMIIETLYGENSDLDVTTINQYRKTREIAHLEAALTGYATAMVNRKRIEEYAEKASELNDQLGLNSDDVNVINEIGNNITAMMLIIKQLNDIQTVLAALVENKATHILRNDAFIQPPRTK